MASFKSGATRNLSDDKLDYDGFLSPLVLERYAQYLHLNRHCKDGTFRASDNWQLGIPLDAYMKSGWRHFMEWWKGHHKQEVDIESALCAVIFNSSGYLHELLRAKQAKNPAPIVGSADGFDVDRAVEIFQAICIHDPIGELDPPCPKCFQFVKLSKEKAQDATKTSG